MVKKSEDSALAMAIDLARQAWRHRPGNETLAAILDTFDALGFETKAGLKPVLCHKHKTAQGWHFVFVLPPGISSRDVEVKISHFEEQTGGKIELESHGNKLHFDVRTSDLPEVVPYEWDDEWLNEYSIPIPIGLTAKGMLVIDLANLPHLTIAGNTGGGKSNFLHVVVNSLIVSGRAFPIVIDLKKLEFSYIKQWALVATSQRQAYEVLRRLNLEMDKRLDILEDAGCVKWQEYKGEGMPYLVLVIDELAELRDEESQDLLNRLVRLSRAAGISVICATQRPSSTMYKNFTDTRAMFAGTLCFQVRDATNSRIVLDNDRAAKLPKIPGRAIWQWQTEVEVQTPYLSVKEAREHLKNLPIKIPVREVAWAGELRTERLLPR